jgi:hypothetical protein
VVLGILDFLRVGLVLEKKGEWNEELRTMGGLCVGDCWVFWIGYLIDVKLNRAALLQRRSRMAG